MRFFRRKRTTAPSPPEWAAGASSPIDPVPVSVVALIVNGPLPAELAECVEPGPDGDGPDWLDVADAVDELARAEAPLPGAVYAMGAYGQLDGCFVMVDETAERAERAAELLDLATAHGVPGDELSHLRRWAESLAESGAEEAEEVAERAELDPATLHGQGLSYRAMDLVVSADQDEVREGSALYSRLAEEAASDPDAVLNARLRQHLALFGLGDREEALPHLVELAAASSASSETAHLLDGARARLVVDAALNEGPEAARAAWDRARRQSDRFPGAGSQVWLVRELRGRGVPSVMHELLQLLRAQEHLDRQGREVLRIAESELGPEV